MTLLHFYFVGHKLEGLWINALMCVFVDNLCYGLWDGSDRGSYKDRCEYKLGWNHGNKSVYVNEK